MPSTQGQHLVNERRAYILRCYLKSQGATRNLHRECSRGKLQPKLESCYKWLMYLGFLSSLDPGWFDIWFLKCHISSIEHRTIHLGKIAGLSISSKFTLFNLKFRYYPVAYNIGVMSHRATENVCIYHSRYLRLQSVTYENSY